MSNTPKKRFFYKHAKSSAAAVSLAIHVILIIIAISFVAVTVITKEDQQFEPKKVNRPRMPIKKLQIPVNIKKKKTQKPKLRKRIVVQPKMNQNMPEIKMPEITGIKGGVGSGTGDGLGGGGVGFSIPEFKIFGVRSKGEKIFIILDSSAYMMYDEIGGIPAYTVIKEELVNILGGLSPTVLFNIAVFDLRNERMLFPKMVPATSSNVAQVENWIKPLNAVKKNMGDRDYGLHTLGTGGSGLPGNLAIKPIRTTKEWSGPTMLAMQQQADAVFILTQGWGHQQYVKAPAQDWSAEKMAKYNAIKRRAAQKLKEENEGRRRNGRSPRVLVGHSIINAYFPGTEHPPGAVLHRYTPKEMVEAFTKQRRAHKPQSLTTSGIGKSSNKKERYSINVIHFVKKNNNQQNGKQNGKQKDGDKLKQLTNLANGSYKTLSSLSAIKSSASSVK